MATCGCSQSSALFADVHQYGLDEPPQPTVLRQPLPAAAKRSHDNDAEPMRIRDWLLRQRAKSLRQLNPGVPAKFRTFSQIYSLLLVHADSSGSGRLVRFGRLAAREAQACLA